MTIHKSINVPFQKRKYFNKTSIIMLDEGSLTGGKWKGDRT